MRNRSQRSITPRPTIDTTNDDEIAVAAVTYQGSPKVEDPTSPTPAMPKRKLADGSEEVNKRLRSGTVAGPKHDLSSSVSSAHVRSPSIHRLSLSTTMRPPSVQINDIDPVAIEKAQNARTAAEVAELRARNDLQNANNDLDDWLTQHEDADNKLSAQEGELALLLAKVEEARKERDELCGRVVHFATHVKKAQEKVEECRQIVSIKTTAAKQAQREMATLMRGE